MFSLLATLFGKRNPVGWTEIYVQELEAARQFYETVFEVKLQKLESPTDDPIEMLMFPGNPFQAGSPVALVRMDGVSSGVGGTVSYFSCRDCAVQQQRFVELGGTVEREKFSIGKHGYIALVKDLDGNLIGLHSMR